MGRNKIIAGNWKMNKNLSEAVSLAQEIIHSSPENNSLKIIFPPFPFIQSVNEILKNKKGFFVGAQNCSEHNAGAYTGEVSASMLNSLGCSYVLIGHSERRQYYNETNVLCSKKIVQALNNNIKPVYCVGETLQQRKSNTHFEIVKSQITEALSSLNSDQIKQVVIAYEPVWAIGTGETATPQQAQEMHAFIRTCMKDLFDSSVSDNSILLYGGSCNASNAKDLFSCEDIDGGLIGGASLKAEDFCKIIASA
ncbi:MAG: triose-phosphate isomerase [Bacteroidetes bacterium]|nr:triose-phosphate isomerase [Bacteroidota bacterium]